MDKRWCFFIAVEDFEEGHGYIPSRVVEGEPGRTLYSGNGSCASPYYWGMDYETARANALKENVKLGLSPDDVFEIACSSMNASREGR